MRKPAFGGFWAPQDPMMTFNATTEDTTSGWDDLIQKIKDSIKYPPYPIDTYP